MERECAEAKYQRLSSEDQEKQKLISMTKPNLSRAGSQLATNKTFRLILQSYRMCVGRYNLREIREKKKRKPSEPTKR